MNGAAELKNTAAEQAEKMSQFIDALTNREGVRIEFLEENQIIVNVKTAIYPANMGAAGKVSAAEMCAAAFAGLILDYATEKVGYSEASKGSECNYYSASGEEVEDALDEDAARDVETVQACVYLD